MLTVAIHSMFTALGVARGKPWWIVIKIDINGAFMQTPMEGEPIYMKINPKMMKYVIELYLKLRLKMGEERCLYTILLKAMYGCVQASALRYALIKSFLEELGYECSKTDRYVFREKVGDRIFILLLYVDDTLAQVDEKEADHLRKQLTKQFGTVQFEIGMKLSYIGMQIDKQIERAMIDMSFYVKQMLDGVKAKVKLLQGTHKLLFIIDKT